jgi:hypothetical protein
MIQLTPTQLERVLSLYTGQEVLYGYEGDPKKKGQLCGQNKPFGWQIFRCKSPMVPYLNVRSELFQLLLIPLCGITREDAIHIGKMELPRTSETHSGEEVFYQTGKMLASTQRLSYQMGDYLRGKGYMLPFEGIDLFVAGIALDKTEMDRGPK